MTEMRQVLYQRTQPLALAHLRVAASQLGDRAGLAGAGQLVLSEVLSPAAIDRSLSTGS